MIKHKEAVETDGCPGGRGVRVPGCPGGICQNLRNIKKRTTALTFDFDFDFLLPPKVPPAPKFAKKNSQMTIFAHF